MNSTTPAATDLDRTGGRAKRSPDPVPNARITDPVGRWLLFIFLVKPIVDLLWGFAVSLGPVKLSPTILFGVLVLVVFLPYRFRYGRYRPPMSRFLDVFVAINVLGALFGLAASTSPNLTATLNSIVRIMDSYVIYYAAYGAAVRFNYQDASQFIRAGFIGTTLAVVINIVAIQIGFGGEKWDAAMYGTAVYRERGLYYDPGTLSNFAFYNVVFAAFWIHSVRGGSAWRIALVGALALCDLYLMATSRSRMATLALGVSMLAYLLVFLRGSQRFTAAAVMGVIGAVALVALDVPFDEMFSRFESDVSTLESNDTGTIGNTASGVSLGKYEGLGSNRGALWADALTEIVRQDAVYIIFGNFFTRINAHSDYIDILARNGLFGLLTYVALIYGLIFATFGLAVKESPVLTKPIRSLAFVLIVAYALYCFPFRPLLYTTTSWYMWTVIGLAFAMTANATKAGRRRPVSDQEPAADRAGAPVSRVTPPAGNRSPNRRG